jgi:hypothetical protein
MKKREKRLELAKETLLSLNSPLETRDLVAAVGGSCIPGHSTAGQSNPCCVLT